jgi:hypothetical protein
MSARASNRPASGPPQEPPIIPPEPSRYLTMDTDLAGREVCFVLNARNLLAATVIRERDRIPDVWGRPQKRLDLRVRQKHESIDKVADLNTGGFKTVVNRVYKPRDLLQVRYSDPCLVDMSGEPVRVPMSLARVTPGTWFFADRFSFQVDAIRYERKPEVNRRSQLMTGMTEEIPNTGEPMVTHRFNSDSLADTIQEIDRLYAMGEGGQSFWDGVELTFIERGE